MNFRGKVISVSDFWENENASSCKVRVKEVSGEYPQEAIFKYYKKGDYKFNKDSIHIKEGDLVDVDFNLRLGDYEGKLYNQISAWKIVKQEIQETNESVNDESDDLPF